MIVPVAPDGRELEEMTRDEIVALYVAVCGADWGEESAEAYGRFVAEATHGDHPDWIIE